MIEIVAKKNLNRFEIFFSDQRADGKFLNNSNDFLVSFVELLNFFRIFGLLEPNKKNCKAYKNLQKKTKNVNIEIF